MTVTKKLLQWSSKIPAFAGMTLTKKLLQLSSKIPAFAGMTKWKTWNDVNEEAIAMVE